MNWHQQGQQSFLEEDYSQAIKCYEQATQLEPEDTLNYLYLGLAYLLQAREADAQTTWLFAMMQGQDEEIDRETQQLLEILETEAQRQNSLNNLQTCWLIRQHIREIAPTEIHNILLLLQLSIDLGTFSPEILQDWQVAELLQKDSLLNVDSALLLNLLPKILDFPATTTLTFIEACLSCAQTPEPWITTLLEAAIRIGYRLEQPDFGIEIVQCCLNIEPNQEEILEHLTRLYLEARRYKEAIESAKKLYQNCHTLPKQFVGNSLILKALLSAGDWGEALDVFRNQKVLLSNLIQSKPTNLPLDVIQYLIVNTGFFFYLEDNLEKNRKFQNQVAELFLENLKTNATKSLKPISVDRKNLHRPLKIGYIAHTLKAHSVGWLCRWLFQHHNREDYQINAYLIDQSSENDFFQRWFNDNIDYTYCFDDDLLASANKIREDQVDILVDLDSLTLDYTCTVMALKPAPVQVTWLGWDASGLPSIDYYIADPYVLPANAQDYYQETIWRLPQTYIAVDGFEVDTPTLRRDLLDIPSDAVIFLSAQRGFKRHPDTARLQLKIIKEVPNSYFLIKGLSDQATVQEFFFALAEEEEVEPDRLRFLPMDRNEYVHRANLQIADIVLDTYPYNGATTTLETLWMGIPLVTRVGKQFAARNSYAFLMNVGVTEGIAWTDEEYIEWGVRLAKDEALRQQVSWKLRASRQTSPLWNARQFAREMEHAYRQMWHTYLESKS